MIGTRMVVPTMVINSLAPGKFELNFRYLIFQIISVIDGWVISCELDLRWMSLNLTDDKSTLVQVMAWCRQATSHYLSQCWTRTLSPYGVTRPQWVKWYQWRNWRNLHFFTKIHSVICLLCKVIFIQAWIFQNFAQAWMCQNLTFKVGEHPSSSGSSMQYFPYLDKSYRARRVM